MKIREDLKPGAAFPDITCSDQDGVGRRLSDLTQGWPVIVVFWRGRY